MAASKGPGSGRGGQPGLVPAPEPQAWSRVRALCLSLPGTTETASWGHPNFRTGKAAYVTLETHLGRPTIAIRVEADQARELCEQGAYFRTPYGKGLWVSHHADKPVPWRQVEDLIRQGYERVKPPGGERG
jgi:predicted DNA-binding protein (MmcQ/YjbR family)